MGEAAEQPLAQRSDLATEAALELRGGGPQCEVCLGADHIHDGLRLGHVHLSVQECAAGKLPWIGQTHAAGQH